MSGKSLADLRKMARAQIKNIIKDELIDTIMSAADDVGAVARLEERLLSIATELGELRRTISSSEINTKKKLEDMQEQIAKQANIVMQQQLFLEKKN